jgi:hypothetical protein
MQEFGLSAPILIDGAVSESGIDRGRIRGGVKFFIGIL